MMLKYASILFLTNSEELADTPASKLLGWPGIKIAEGTMLLGPKPNQPWKCPVVPFTIIHSGRVREGAK